MTVDVSALDHELDRLVCRLYGLTPEEIAILEESCWKSTRIGIIGDRYASKGTTTPSPARISSRCARGIGNAFSVMLLME
jgi:hypothetical protein